MDVRTVVIVGPGLISHLHRFRGRSAAEAVDVYFSAHGLKKGQRFPAFVGPIGPVGLPQKIKTTPRKDIEGSIES